jgi:hypothetical protein
VAYLLKSKTPRRNSEGFFGVSGLPTQYSTNVFIPNVYRRQDRFCKLCVQYVKKPSPKGGFIYYKTLVTPPDALNPEVFAITEQEFNSSFVKTGFCKETPSTK